MKNTAITLERNETIKRLQEILKPGDKVYTILRKVSKSGMSRRIDFYHFKGESKYFLTGFIAKVGKWSYTLNDWQQGRGLRVDGCGMDMGFHVVYELGHILFKDGYALNQEWL